MVVYQSPLILTAYQLSDKRCLSHGTCLYRVVMMLHFLNGALLFCQPRVEVTSRFVYKVMGLTCYERINTQLIYRIAVAQVVARRITKPQRTFFRFESQWLQFFIYFYLFFFFGGGGGGGGWRSDFIILFMPYLFLFLFIFIIIIFFFFYPFNMYKVHI